MPRYSLDIEYDGTGYAGWQRQDDHPSIQQAIETAIHGFCGETVASAVPGGPMRVSTPGPGRPCRSRKPMAGRHRA
jgi:tRNA U38,U39,U40 pseudouridine synthase TruA